MCVVVVIVLVVFDCSNVESEIDSEEVKVDGVFEDETMDDVSNNVVETILDVVCNNSPDVAAVSVELICVVETVVDGISFCDDDSVIIMVDGISVEESIRVVDELYSAEVVSKSVVLLVGVIDGDSFDNVVVCKPIIFEVTVDDDSEDGVEFCDCEIRVVEFSVGGVVSAVLCISESVDETSSDIVVCVVFIVSAVLPNVARVDEDNNVSVEV